MATFYINRRQGKETETVDEFNNGKEAAAMRNEYTFSDSAGHYWVSRRCCKGWKV